MLYILRIESYETGNDSNWRDGYFGCPREPRMARHSANPVPYLVSRSGHHFLRIFCSEKQAVTFI